MFFKKHSYIYSDILMVIGFAALIGYLISDFSNTIREKDETIKDLEDAVSCLEAELNSKNTPGWKRTDV